MDNLQGVSAEGFGATSHDADEDDRVAPLLSAHARARRSLASQIEPAPDTGDAEAGIAPAAQELPTLLRTLRGEAKLTLAQVARMVGVSSPTVWAWEHGRAKPTRNKIGVIADAFGVGHDVVALAASKQNRRAPEAPVAQGSDSYRARLLDAGRQLIAKAYNVAPGAIRISVEL